MILGMWQIPVLLFGILFFPPNVGDPWQVSLWLWNVWMRRAEGTCVTYDRVSVVGMTEHAAHDIPNFKCNFNSFFYKRSSKGRLLPYRSMIKFAFCYFDIYLYARKKKKVQSSDDQLKRTVSKRQRKNVLEKWLNAQDPTTDVCSSTQCTQTEVRSKGSCSTA